MAAPTNDRGGVRQVLRALKNAGADDISYYDEDYDERVYLTGKPEKEILDEVMNYDELWVRFVKGTEGIEGYDRIAVRFVFGNEPYEVVCEYTIYSEAPGSFYNVVNDLTNEWIFGDDEDDD